MYTFNVILCDNEIDRDYECFNLDALNQLAQLFLGKTGIFDHNPKGENQTARIYATQVIKDDLLKNQLGQPYYYLQAKAYMVKSQKNSDMILDIDAGIKKEVSVGCSVANSICSICQTDTKKSFCEHRKGATYNNQLCYTTLSNPTDAYEWSFVAIPAQKNAGVTKKYNDKNTVEKLAPKTYEQILKSFATGKTTTISDIEGQEILKNIASLKEIAQIGEVYLKQLRNEVVKLAYLCGETIQSDVFSKVVEKMNIDEILTFKKAYEDKLNKTKSYMGQLNKNIEEKKPLINNQFKI